MKMLYKYPQAEFPYGRLVEESSRRGTGDPEFELIDALRETFDQHRYFDVLIEYAKAAQDDILCRITATNRGPRSRADPCASAPAGFATPGPGRPVASRENGPGPTRKPECRVFAPRTRTWGTASGTFGIAVRLRPLPCSSPRTRPTRAGCSDPRTRRRYVKDGIHDAVAGGRPRTDRPGNRHRKSPGTFRATLVAGGVVNSRRCAWPMRRAAGPSSTSTAVLSRRHRRGRRISRRDPAP